MKIFIATIALIGFMGSAIYLLLTEKKFKKYKSVKPQMSISKAIGEKPSRDLYPYELQRMRINSEAVISFESMENKNDSYELNEEELGDFSMQLKNLKKNLKIINNFDFHQPIDEINAQEREHYELAR